MKIVTAVLITASVASFATLGEGGKKSTRSTERSLLSNKSYTYSSRGFSLRSGYNYRGSNILINPSAGKYFTLNTTVVTYQKGNTTYILPLKRKIILDKIKFNPAQ
jgi:hypothetical protein